MNSSATIYSLQVIGGGDIDVSWTNNYYSILDSGWLCIVNDQYHWKGDKEVKSVLENIKHVF